MNNYDILKEYEAHKAPVPSYDEWVYLHKARNDAHEIVESLTQENQQLKTDCKNLAQKLLQVKPELRDWLEVNFKEYL